MTETTETTTTLLSTDLYNALADTVRARAGVGSLPAEADALLIQAARLVGAAVWGEEPPGGEATGTGLSVDVTTLPELHRSMVSVCAVMAQDDAEDPASNHQPSTIAAGIVDRMCRDYLTSDETGDPASVQLVEYDVAEEGTVWRAVLTTPDRAHEIESTNYLWTARGRAVLLSEQDAVREAQLTAPR